MLKKGDLILVGFLAAVIIASYIWLSMARSKESNVHRIALIKQTDKVIERIDLDAVKEPYKINIPGDFNIVVAVEQGRIRFEKADCPDRVCVNTGWLSKKGDLAVCLPNKTIVKIEGDKDAVDGVTY